ncbi:cyclic nucleotide-binding domain-containing protein [Maritimibacter sp. HL-12]|jgi:CRP/FNR family transcriptional regulator, cyclic AMP receptor protein|uniref:cyclic nucleotide-binding domain-containing protein n=1 Tax=Maritimibacter sp. HL-12 TaxID=1162418 RepID=UPI000A0F3079|nr:cyclic nucleotide-binding domain-containing protein [Maritimibacter sp. HL-12]SMH52666.1 Cyclic nucleotide-binding domain-containing protein [Maritimibacter sp. HL-12]
MAIEGLQRILAAHPLFSNLSPAFLDMLAGCAKNTRFAADSYLFHEGDDADQFYLVRDGHVALEISAPGHGRMVFQTVGGGGVIGLSWLVPPYRWRFDAHAKEDTRAIAFDATCLRGKCDTDPALGYAVMKQILPALVDRLHDTRVQMLDLYDART